MCSPPVAASRTLTLRINGKRSKVDKQRVLYQLIYLYYIHLADYLIMKHSMFLFEIQQRTPYALFNAENIGNKMTF